jgi:hypothetical protein
MLKIPCENILYHKKREVASIIQQISPPLFGLNQFVVYPADSGSQKNPREKSHFLSTFYKTTFLSEKFTLS